MAAWAQRAWLSWALAGILAVLCGVLAVLQYRWIGETTEAERERLHGELHSQLIALSRAFHAEVRDAFMRDPSVGREPGRLPSKFNTEYVRGSVLPRLVGLYLSTGGVADYDWRLVDNGEPWNGAADDSVALLDFPPDGGPGFPPPHEPGARWRGGPPPPPPGDHGRWRLVVWHRAGSLEALVAQTRKKNLAVSAGILLLILATVATLAHAARRAQRLARQQLDFVAGVSHELRTPLTVMRTAGFNLCGRVASRPEQVERYGRLIQAESERLQALVERVLHFASIEAGHIIRRRDPVAVETLLEESLASAREDRLQVEKRIEAELPRISGDAVALRQAIQNLVDNAVKHGAGKDGWLGVQARTVTAEGKAAVEIRVADRGPGIPAEEQRHIFDAFFRGRRAIEEQVHGTGLGLSLSRKIVEAHGGTICVKSEAGKGTEFVVRIPSRPAESQDEPAYSLN